MLKYIVNKIKDIMFLWAPSREPSYVEMNYHMMSFTLDNGMILDGQICLEIKFLPTRCSTLEEFLKYNNATMGKCRDNRINTNCESATQTL